MSSSKVDKLIAEMNRITLDEIARSRIEDLRRTFEDFTQKKIQSPLAYVPKPHASD